MKNADGNIDGAAEAIRMAQEASFGTECPGTGRTLGEAIDEAEREFNVRERCFPKWVTEGRITRSDAKDRLERLAAACYFLRCLSCGDVAGCVEAEAKLDAAADS